jgi:hypothetical protein
VIERRFLGGELAKQSVKEIEMQKIMMVAAFALALGFSGTALAADLSNLSGQSCGGDTGDWHFVNVQTRGEGPGTLTAQWDSGDSCTVSASKVNRNNQHFNCVASGELVSAFTNLGGRLVLSDFSCEAKCTKNCEPPPPPK